MTRTTLTTLTQKTPGQGLRHVAAIVLTAAALAAQADHHRPANPSDGQLHRMGAQTMAWDARANAWVTPEAFWVRYAEQSRGKYWGRTATYPPYGDVNEHDTLLIEVEEGACLMYFFHRRWRRAQDVRRWDPAFNQIAGCPHVFD